MQRVAFFGWLGCCSVLWMVVTGCGGGGPTGPGGTVTGTVTYQGKPVPEGCSVMFVGQGKDAYNASGKAGGDGKYSLICEGKTKVPVGKYTVQFSDPAAAPSGVPDATAVPGASKSLLPSKYYSSATSGLTFDVKEGPNSIDITLE